MSDIRTDAGTFITIGHIPSVLNIGNLHGKPFIQFHPDGAIVLANDAKPSEAAQAMLDIVAPVFAASRRKLREAYDEGFVAGRDASSLKAQVQTFQAMNGVSQPATPTIPEDSRVRLRASLIVEETLETIGALFSDGKGYQSALDRISFALSCFTKEAPVKVDMVAFADGCADLDYVTEGARLEFGIDGGPIAAEVHRSNMTKAGGPVREDGKVMKPPGWAPPDVAGELRKQGWRP